MWLRVSKGLLLKPVELATCHSLNLWRADPLLYWGVQLGPLGSTAPSYRASERHLQQRVLPGRHGCKARRPSSSRFGVSGLEKRTPRLLPRLKVTVARGTTITCQPGFFLR